MSLRALCANLRKPADFFIYIALTADIFASGSLHAFLHRWRWVVTAMLTIALLIEWAGRSTRKPDFQEASHV